MIIRYLPTEELWFESISVRFNEPRDSIREKLGPFFTEDNNVIDLGGHDKLINQRRDIYENLNLSENLFTLTYDESDLLKEIEVHYCDKLQVNNFIFDYSNELAFIASGLQELSSISKVSEGEYFFKDIKVCLLSKCEMGGESDESTLGYFYCARDVKHLEE